MVGKKVVVKHTMALYKSAILRGVVKLFLLVTIKFAIIKLKEENVVSERENTENLPVKFDT